VSRVLPWIALSLLALLTLAQAAPDFRARRALPQPLPALEDELACSAHGCGCPHEAIAESCCCAPEPAALVARALPSRRRTGAARASTAPPARPDPHASGILTSFACNGGKRDPVRAPNVLAPAAMPASSRAELPLSPPGWEARPRAWWRLAPAVEPSTPPPRGARRA